MKNHNGDDRCTLKPVWASVLPALRPHLPTTRRLPQRISDNTNLAIATNIVARF